MLLLLLLFCLSCCGSLAKGTSSCCHPCNSSTAVDTLETTHDFSGARHQLSGVVGECPTGDWELVGSIPGRIKPKTMKMAPTASQWGVGSASDPLARHCCCPALPRGDDGWTEDTFHFLWDVTITRTLAQWSVRCGHIWTTFPPALALLGLARSRSVSIATWVKVPQRDGPKVP